MSLLSVQRSLIAVLGSRAWKFTPLRVLTRSVEELQFTLHILRFTKFYRNHQGDFCCYKPDCAYFWELSSITSHSNRDLFSHNKSSSSPNPPPHTHHHHQPPTPPPTPQLSGKHRYPAEYVIYWMMGLSAPSASLQAAEIWKEWFIFQRDWLSEWSFKETLTGWRKGKQESHEVQQREKSSPAPVEEQIRAA